MKRGEGTVREGGWEGGMREIGLMKDICLSYCHN